MTIELDLLLVELRNRTYTDKTIPAVVYYLEILNKQLRLASDIKNLKEAQGQGVTWDSDDYMRGLFNGLELASSILEQREPKFKPVFTEIEKKNEEIRTLKNCLFQIQEAAKELLNLTDRQDKTICTPKKTLQESDIETEYTEERGKIFKDKWWKGLTDDEFDQCDVHETWRSMKNVEAKLKEKNT